MATKSKKTKSASLNQAKKMRSPQKKEMAKRMSQKSETGDIISLILEHHRPIKEPFAVMKDIEASREEKEEALEAFAAALLPHAQAEQEVLYAHIKHEEEELRTEGFEGDCEHAIAENLLEDIENTSDEDEWKAKVKVLAELVEHHIEEEEGEMFKDCKKEIPLETRRELGAHYRELYEKYSSQKNFEKSKSKEEQMTTLM